jgi:hypothetical protein
LNQLEVTDFTYIDTVTAGHRIHKKLVAQQAEQVIPEAVAKRKRLSPRYLYSRQIAYSKPITTKVFVYGKQHDDSKALPGSLFS